MTAHGPDVDASPVMPHGRGRLKFRSALQELPTREFASLGLAITFIDTARRTISSFGDRELIDALERLDAAYHQFPELEVDRPREDLIEDLRSIAEHMPDRVTAILLLYCVSLKPSCSSSVISRLAKIDGPHWLSSVLQILLRGRDIPWGAVSPILEALRQQGRADAMLQVVSEVLDYITFSDKGSAIEFRDILQYLLGDQESPENNGPALTEVVLSARRHLTMPPRDEQYAQGSREALLAMAERLRMTPPPARHNPQPVLAWPSGRMSFDEFLLQWPCEIELPMDLEDASFIEEAHRAILLREPETTEIDQYLRLIQGGVSKLWILEDLLASKELRSLDRRLRVISGGHVITEPGSLADGTMAAVTWPWRWPR